MKKLLFQIGAFTSLAAFLTFPSWALRFVAVDFPHPFFKQVVDVQLYLDGEFWNENEPPTLSCGPAVRWKIRRDAVRGPVLDDTDASFVRDETWQAKNEPNVRRDFIFFIYQRGTVMTEIEAGKRPVIDTVWREVLVPNWRAEVMFACLPTFWAALVLRRWCRNVRAKSWRTASKCGTCGYDLRATPEKCPECGQSALPRSGK